MVSFQDFEDVNFDPFDTDIPKELIGTDLSTELMALNDDESYSFEEIADWIEDNVEFYEEETPTL